MDGATDETDDDKETLATLRVGHGDRLRSTSFQCRAATQVANGRGNSRGAGKSTLPPHGIFPR